MLLWLEMVSKWPVAVRTIINVFLSLSIFISLDVLAST